MELNWQWLSSLNLATWVMLQPDMHDALGDLKEPHAKMNQKDVHACMGHHLSMALW